MCQYCDKSPNNVIYYNEDDMPYYLHKSKIHKFWHLGTVYEQIYVRYCPWCGRKLTKGE